MGRKAKRLRQCCCCLYGCAVISAFVFGFACALQGCFDRSSTLPCFWSPLALNSTLVNGTSGIAVAATCSGRRVAVGTHHGEVEVYAFNLSSNSFNNEQLLSPLNTETADLFGASLAMDCVDGWLAVGSPGADTMSGRVTVYRSSGGSYAPVSAQPMLNPAAPDQSQFGASMAMSCYQKTLAVGAPGADGNAGVVYMYTLAATPVLEETLLAPVSHLTAASSFGAAVALACDGRTLAVGAPDDAAGRGATLVYTLVDGVWNFTQKIEGSSATASAGSAVALASRGRRLVVGEPMSNGGGGALVAAGGAQVYDVKRGESDHTFTVRLDGATSGERLGHRVSASHDGTLLVASAWSMTAEPGRVARYACTGSTCTLVTAEPQLDEPEAAGADALISYAGTLVATTAASDAANSTRVGTLLCTRHIDVDCPVC